MTTVLGPGGADRDVRLRRLALAVFVVTTILFLVGLGFLVANAIAGEGGLLGSLLYGVITYAFPVVGILVVRHQPRNAVTWILLGIGLSFGLSSAMEGYANAALAAYPGSLPAGAVVAALQSWLWAPAVILMGTFLLLLFPDGRLPSPRWRPVAWLSVVALAVAVFAIVFAPGTLADEGFPELANPLGVPALRSVIAVMQVDIIVIPICIVLCGVALVGRFRRSTGIERLQLKWLVAAAATVGIVYAVAMVVSIPVPWLQSATPKPVQAVQALAIASFALVPIAIGVAILRYRLYDIDRLISRVVSYAIVTAVLVGVYAAVAVGLGTAFGRSGNPVLIAGATLLVAGLFGPLRRRVQAAVDRRFNRHRYDAEMVLGAFSSRLRDELDLDTLTVELASTASSAVQPASVGVWIRGGGATP
jgi:MFS family permease